MGNENSQEGAKRLLGGLEHSIREVKNKLSRTRMTCPAPKARIVREYLSRALKPDKNQSAEKRFEKLLGSLRKAEKKIDEFRRDFHSKQMEALQTEIGNVIGKYETVISNGIREFEKTLTERE